MLELLKLLKFDSLPRLADRLWFCGPAERLRGALEEVAGLVAPVWCAGCSVADVDLCAACSAQLRRAASRPFRAERWAAALPLRPDAESAAGFSVLPVVAAARYEGVVSQAVLAYKDREFVGLERVLAPALSRSVRAARASPAREPASSRRLLLVIPPRTMRSRLKRSFDPVARLLDCAGLGADVVGLLRGRSPISGQMLNSGQKGRGSDARRRSLASTMDALRGPGRDVLLVDDVLTTGATLAEMHRALTGAGHRVHGAAVLAATPKSTSLRLNDEFPAAR